MVIVWGCDMLVDESQSPHAFVFAIAFLTTSRLCFFANMMLKRPKSSKAFLRCRAARLVAHPDLFHFSTIASFSSCFLTTPEPAARGSFVRARGVRVRCLNWYGWRGTFVVGPSIMAYMWRMVNVKCASGRKENITRVWSMISVITAMLPDEGPDLSRTTCDWMWVNLGWLMKDVLFTYLGRPQRNVWSLIPITKKK